MIKVEIPAASGGGAAVWGDITGTLSNQTDLNTELNSKLESPIAISDVTNLSTSLSGKQDTLVSGTNIKTINSTSIVGSGDVAITGGLTNFTESKTTATPNATIPTVNLVATATETNVDFVIKPKGTGSIIAAIPDNTATGGNKRGENAVDLQTSRTSNSKVASGQASVVSGGVSNQASGSYSTVGGGGSNQASGSWTTVGGGSGNQASGSYSTVGGGSSNQASGSWTTVGGGSYNRSYLYGMGILQGYNSLATTKKRQYSQLSMQKQTTDATVTEIFLDDSSARLVLPDNTSWHVEVIITAHQNDQVYSCKYHRELLINRGANAAATALESTVQTIGTDIENTNLSTCTIALTADTTNGSLKVEVTGKAATTINWQAVINILEIEN